MSLRSIKRGKWVKAARACLNRLERFSIASYEGGSKVKPYFVTTVLEVLSSREYNSWDERCLYSQQLLLAFDPAYVDCRWVTSISVSMRSSGCSCVRPCRRMRAEA